MDRKQLLNLNGDDDDLSLSFASQKNERKSPKKEKQIWKSINTKQKLNTQREKNTMAILNDSSSPIFQIGGDLNIEDLIVVETKDQQHSPIH